jgi:hypothetical protein
MPKALKPVTYNQHVAKVIDGLMGERGVGREELAQTTAISFPTLDRNMRGDTQAGWTVSQVVRIAAALGSDVGYIAQRALDNFGGIDKLLSEVRSKKDNPSNDAEVVDMLDRRSREESKAVNQQQIAALRGKKGSE